MLTTLTMCKYITKTFERFFSRVTRSRREIGKSLFSLKIMEFKGTKSPWKVKHSESKEAFNVIGTALGGKYKIARCPYFKGRIDGKLSEAYNESERLEAEANALLISKAPEMLEMLQNIVDYGGVANFNNIKKLIKKATEL